MLRRRVCSDPTFAPPAEHVTPVLDPPLPDVFNVSGPMGPPVSIQQEIDDLYNPTQDNVFSYGATLPRCYATRLPKSLKQLVSLNH